MKRRKLSRRELCAKIKRLEDREAFLNDRLLASVKLGSQIAELAASQTGGGITGADVIQVIAANNEAHEGGAL